MLIQEEEVGIPQDILIRMERALHQVLLGHNLARLLAVCARHKLVAQEIVSLPRGLLNDLTKYELDK